MGDISGKVAIITGAGRGIGRGIARALTRTGAREWGKYKINVNVISPSVRTDALDEFERKHPESIKASLANVPLGRYGDPVKDAGPLAIFLGSSDSDFITGMTFMLDGGLFMYP